MSRVAAESGIWLATGPEGGEIWSLAVDPSTPTTLYTATGAGLFQSTDGGGSVFANLPLEHGLHLPVILQRP